MIERIQGNSSEKSALSIMSQNELATTLKVGSKVAKKVAKYSLAFFVPIYLKCQLAYEIYKLASEHGAHFVSKKQGREKSVLTPRVFGDYFSKNAPSKGIWDVTSFEFNPGELYSNQKVLKQIFHSVSDNETMLWMSAQWMTKVFVHKMSGFIQEGMEIFIPVVNKEGNRELVKYRVQKRFDVGYKIPAFGLVDPAHRHPTILLFRPTTTSLKNIEALSTMAANFHPEGPAKALYKKSKLEITDWLKATSQDTGQKAQVMGFSQGGALGAYFLTYHSELFSDHESSPSFIFDAPGVNSTVEKKWEEITQKPVVKTFVNRGDLIPKFGKRFIGQAFEIQTSGKFSGVANHLLLSLFSPQWQIREINNHLEKESIVRAAAKQVEKVATKVLYHPIKHWITPCLQGLIHSY